MDPITILIFVLVAIVVFGIGCAIMIYGENKRVLDRLNHPQRLRSKSFLAFSLGITGVKDVESESGNRDRKKGHSGRHHKKSRDQDDKAVTFIQAQNPDPTGEHNRTIFDPDADSALEDTRSTIPDIITEADVTGNRDFSALGQDPSRTEYQDCVLQKGDQNELETRKDNKMLVAIPSSYDNDDATSRQSVLVEYDLLDSTEEPPDAQESSTYNTNELPPIRGVPPPAAEYVSQQ